MPGRRRGSTASSIFSKGFDSRHLVATAKLIVRLTPEQPMPLPPLFANLRLPVIASPMFIVSGPELVIAQCKAGIVGSFPSLNARPIAQLDEWLHRITEELAAHNRANPERP